MAIVFTIGDPALQAAAHAPVALLARSLLLQLHYRRHGSPHWYCMDMSPRSCTRSCGDINCYSGRLHHNVMLSLLPSSSSGLPAGGLVALGAFIIIDFGHTVKRPSEDSLAMGTGETPTLLSGVPLRLQETYCSR